MITILILTIIFHIIISLIIEGYIYKPDVVTIMISLWLAIMITIIISLILFSCNIGSFETDNVKYFDEIYIDNEKCYMTHHEINNDSTYSIKKYDLKLRDCTFIDDGREAIEHQRWNFGKGLNWTFLLPLEDNYIIHK